jgi:DNA-binding transcriptional LysR family regulator
MISWSQHARRYRSRLFTFCWCSTKADFVLDIRKLNMLAELERLGTIVAVAKSLNLTPPGISMQLAGLEREVGIQLTEKQGRRIVLTPAGHLLARHGSSIVDLLTVAEMEAISLRDGAVGTYRVAAFPTAAKIILPQAWKTFTTSVSPGVQIRLIEMHPTRAIPALIASEIELAIAHRYTNMPPLTGPGLAVTEIATEKVRLAVRTSELRAQTVYLGDFADHNWIVPSRELTCYSMVHRATNFAGFEPRTVAEATDFGVQLALVAAGVGVALIPELGTMQLPDGVVMLDLEDPIYRNIVTVSRTTSATDAGLSRIQRAIAEAAGSLGLSRTTQPTR